MKSIVRRLKILPDITALYMANRRLRSTGRLSWNYMGILPDMAASSAIDNAYWRLVLAGRFTIRMTYLSSYDYAGASTGSDYIARSVRPVAVAASLRDTEN